jgi:hypothetical protein
MVVVKILEQLLSLMMIATSNNLINGATLRMALTTLVHPGAQPNNTSKTSQMFTATDITLAHWIKCGGIFMEVPKPSRRTTGKITAEVILPTL